MWRRRRLTRRGRLTDVIEGLTFIGFALVVGLWVFVWGLLGSLLANSRGLSFGQGLIQGVLLGPVGVALIPLLDRHRGAADQHTTQITTHVGSDPFGDSVFGARPDESAW